NSDAKKRPGKSRPASGRFATPLELNGHRTGGLYSVLVARALLRRFDMGQNDRTGLAKEASSFPLSPPREEDGGGLFERLLLTRKVLERERADAPGLLANLLGLPPWLQAEQIGRDPRYQTWGLADLLL